MIFHRKSCKYRLCHLQQRSGSIQECRRSPAVHRGRYSNGFVRPCADRELQRCYCRVRKPTICRWWHRAPCGRCDPRRPAAESCASIEVSSPGHGRPSDKGKMPQTRPCAEDSVSFARVCEIVELGDAVSLGPDTDFASVLECVVIPFNRFLSVERDCEAIPTEIDTQSVPCAGCDFNIGSLFLDALASDCVVNRHVVFERVGARDVVVVRVLHSPNNTASLILLARNWLEFHLDKSVFDVRVVLDANWKRRLT